MRKSTYLQLKHSRLPWPGWIQHRHIVLVVKCFVHAHMTKGNIVIVKKSLLLHYLEHKTQLRVFCNVDI